MKLNRRDTLLGLLFGGGMLGMRSIASGLPVALLANPRKALADMTPTCGNASKAQYVIFNTSAQGDPINTNAPGTYLDSNIVHPSDPSMAPTNITVGGKQWQAAAPWATLGATLGRTTFFHNMTNTPIHPKEHDVLELMGISNNNEMFPSLMAQMLAPCLGTLQPQPVSVGGTTGETISYGGAALPTIPRRPSPRRSWRPQATRSSSSSATRRSAPSWASTRTARARRSSSTSTRW